MNYNEIEIANELANSWKMVDNFNGFTRFMIYEFEDRPVEEQLGDIRKVFKKIKKDYRKIAREKEKKEVK